MRQPIAFELLRVDHDFQHLLPLVGIAFGFDAINGERAQGTLPRLLSQPIHRDDVVNGKFAAGLAVIGLVLVAMLALISGYGLFRLGIVPTAVTWKLTISTASACAMWP